MTYKILLIEDDILLLLFAGDRFVMMTGVPVSPGSFFLKSIALFFGVYAVYFVVTYISFCRNMEKQLSFLPQI